MKALKTSYLLLLFVILLSSCATTADPFRHDPTTFSNAVKNNDIKTVKQLLAGKSFKEKSLRSTFIKLFKNSYEYERSGDANTYIHQAITGSGDTIYNPPICRNEIVEELLKAQLEPFSMHLADAATLPCPKIVRTLIPLLPKRKLDHAAEIIIERLTKNTYLIENRLLSNLDSWNTVFNLLANSEISSDLITKLNEAKDNLYVKTKNQKSK